MLNALFYLGIGFAAISVTRYLVYLFSTPWYVLKQERYLRSLRRVSQNNIEQKLKVSVIVPAWNEEVGIRTSVMSLLASDYNNLEIIVVNDGSTDKTHEVMLNFLQNGYQSGLFGNKSLFYIQNHENGGKGHALNTGIKKSSGDLIITMDADTRFEPDAVYKMVRYFINNEIDAAVGNVKISNNKSILGRMQQIEYTMSFYFKRAHVLYGSEYIVGGAFGAFRRDVFEKYGFFDEYNKTEDIEFSIRLQANGCNIMYAEDAIAYTEGPTTLKGLFKQRLRWKKGRFDALLKYKTLFFSTNKSHKFFLTHILLPLSLLCEIQILVDPILVGLTIYYIVATGEYSAFLVWAVLMVAIISIGYLFGSKKNNYKTLLFSPLYMILYIVINMAEWYAVVGSVILLLRKKNVVWQSWQRIGVENV